MPARRLIGPLFWGTAAAALLAAGGAEAQNAATHPQIAVPPSGLERPEDVGVRAHTNVEVFVPAGGYQPNVAPPKAGKPPGAGYLFETPASVACAYGLVAVTAGCNPYTATANPTGGSRAIAVVDAYDDKPHASKDLAAFDKQFGVAAAELTVIYGTGKPSAGCKNGSTVPPSASGTGWDLEEALDIEWAHAMAPKAKIYLVEAASNSDTDLFNAEQVAAACVQANTEGQVSNSFGSSEYAGETAFDADFTASKVVYLAAAGDNFGVSYPAASPHVIGVGGSAFSRNQITGDYQGQASWSNEDIYGDFGQGIGTGGGPSAVEDMPSFQSSVAGLVGNARGTPDLGAIADPATPVWVYSTTYCAGWCGVGGTSVATPMTAGIFNQLGMFFASSDDALTAIYNDTDSLRSNSVNPIVNGNCGPPGAVTTGGFPNGYGQPYDPAFNQASLGFAYNYCTGWGNIQSSRLSPGPT